MCFAYSTHIVADVEYSESTAYHNDGNHRSPRDRPPFPDRNDIGEFHLLIITPPSWNAEFSSDL